MVDATDLNPFGAVDIGGKMGSMGSILMVVVIAFIILGLIGFLF